MINRLKSFAVFALTFILLYLVIRKVGLPELISLVRVADPAWLFFSLCIAPLSVLVSVIKWKILLNSQDIFVPFPRLYALYLVGHFFNNFLPSTVGGDVVRAYELGNFTKNNAAAIASVFMERLTGLIALIIVALISLLNHLDYLNDFRLSLVMVIAVAGLIVVLWFVLDARPILILDRWIRVPLFKRYLTKIKMIHSSLKAYQDKRLALIHAMIWSFAFMIIAISNVYISARVFYQPISYLEVASIVPIILIVAMMPFTLNGLGLQEWAYVFLFSWIGLPASVGLLTILLIRSKGILLATIGGVLYPFIKLLNKSELSHNRLG